MNASTLADIGPGFDDAVQGTQQVFRSVLEALSRPGTLQTLPGAALAGLQPPAGLSTAVSLSLCAVLLTLLDADTTLQLGTGLDAPGVAAYLRFHTGVRLSHAAAEADFAAWPAARATAELWHTLRLGSDEAPQDGATLIIEVPALHAVTGANAHTLLLRGPGIRTEQTLAVAGLSPAFWQARQALEAEFPRGIDLILCCGTQIAALPRSTRLQLQGD